jgi:hypothetical protein
MFVSEIFDECAEILGSTDTKKVFRKIQQAVQTLMESGHWTHTTAEVDVCTGWDRCSLALPRGIDVPLAVNVDGSPTYFRNRLFQYHVNKGGMYNSVEWAWDDRGYVSTLMDIIQPSQLVAVAESNNDVGKKIRVLGTDQNNRNLRSQMPNGMGVDGLLISIHSQQDFQYGTIAPDDATIATRDVAIDPITDFTTTTPHGLTSGQGMSARVLTGTIPVPLNDGQTYYVGVIDAVTVQLFSDSLNAQALQYPIALSSIVGFGSMQLRDQRNAQVVTSLEFASAPAFAIDSPNEVVFPTLPLPAPLEQKKTYFAQPIDSTHLNIFSSLSDAKSNSNPIYTTGSMSPIDIDIRKAIVPETKLVFSVRHYFSDGDQVQAFTAGGVLPQPLIANQNYFVNVIDNFSVSLHENQADAISSSPTNFVNPIKITTAGSGTNSLVKLIQATARIGTESQITAPGFPIATPSGSGAVFQAVLVGSVTSVRITSGGSGYAVAPGVTFSLPPPPPSGSTITTRQATGYAIIVSGSVTNVVITDPGAGYQAAPSVTFDSGSAVAVATVTTSFIAGYIKINGGSGYVDAPEVKITGGGGTGATATAVVDSGTGQVTQLNVVTSGTGYISSPSVGITSSSGVFVNFSSTGALPTPLISGTTYRAESPLDTATGTFTVQNTDFSDVNITSSGTGTFYVVLSRAFGVDFTNNWLGDFTTLSSGQSIYFGSDFILPTTSPSIDNGVTQFFLNIVSNSVSRAYTSSSSAIGGLNQDTITLATLSSGGTTTATATTLTPHYLSSGQSVRISGASIAAYNGTFTVLSASTNSFTYAVTSGLGTPTGTITATTGLINIDSFGTGQTYYAIRTQVSPSVDENLITPINIGFLTEDQVVQFSSSGTLPTPLVAFTNYTIKIIGDSVRVYNGASPVVLTSTGNGQLSLDIIRNVTVQPSNNIVADASLYETGTLLVTRAKEGDTLPTGLLPNTNYYVRRIDNNSFELYDTLAHARNLTSTTGRRTYTTTGNSVSSTFFVDAISDPIFVKSVAHIEKPLTDGYVSLYAWDYGRSNDMTLIGQYHPTEINPQYRRIRIGKPCAWARIIYKVTNPSITSVYDYIPLEQERAIIAAVHAVDLEDKDFADQAMRYWQIAFGYLKNQQESIDGHAMVTPQINGITYGDTTDPVMF